MSEPREPHSIIGAAEQAAAAGDYPLAERLLREAALLQEARLGPRHPELAHTLNNLGVVCEITGNTVDAELCFRRAYAIATSAFAPDHPFVATSRQNLEEFCAARGKPVEPANPQAIIGDVNAKELDAFPAEHANESKEPPATERHRKPHRFPILAVMPIAIVLMIVATRTLFNSNGDSTPSPQPSIDSSESAVVAATSSPLDPAANPLHDGGNGAAPMTGETTAAQPTDSRDDEGMPTTSAQDSPSVAVVQLCRDLSTSQGWRCVPPDVPIGPGPLYFYTRLKSPAGTTVEHRWYRDDRLRETTTLPIRANIRSGYRTYSRHTVDGQGAGEWRIELRSRNGVLLHEERFVVR